MTRPLRPSCLSACALERYAAQSAAGNFYRAGARRRSDAVGGMPSTASSAAVTAAVRLGYKVAEAQIDRTARLARRLRDAGDQAAGVRATKGIAATRRRSTRPSS